LLQSLQGDNPSLPPLKLRGGEEGLSFGTEVKPHKNAQGIGEISDDLFQGRGKFSNQGRDGKDLVSFGKLGILYEVDHLNVIFARHMFFADLLEIVEGGNRFGRMSCHVEPQFPEKGILVVHIFSF
jgi:hypothetical protein